MEDNVRAHAIISGRVQGVFFRVETQRAANGIGVSGWVRNRSDGTVEAVFEGDRTRIDAVLEWCQEGPPHANVVDVNVTWDDYTGEFQGFEITY
ncbi:MAG: acylphosphatase [Desulfobacterales bacterium]|nr:acylphosphatase [Desulfobacterales bacterium]